MYRSSGWLIVVVSAHQAALYLQAILDSPVKEDTEIERVLDALKQLSFDKGRGTLTLSNLQLSCISEEVAILPAENILTFASVCVHCN